MNNVTQIAPYLKAREIAKCLLDDDYLQKQRDRALEKHLERLKRDKIKLAEES
jgi:hypothetical protein